MQTIEFKAIDNDTTHIDMWDCEEKKYAYNHTKYVVVNERLFVVSDWHGTKHNGIVIKCDNNKVDELKHIWEFIN